MREPEQGRRHDQRRQRGEIRPAGLRKLLLYEAAEERFFRQAGKEQIDRRPEQEQGTPMRCEARVTQRIYAGQAHYRGEQVDGRRARQRGSPLAAAEEIGIDEAEHQDADDHLRETHGEGVGLRARRQHLRGHELHTHETRQQRQSHRDAIDEEREARDQLQRSPRPRGLRTASRQAIGDGQHRGDRNPERCRPVQRTRVIARADRGDERRHPGETMDPQAEHGGQQQGEGQDS